MSTSLTVGMTKLFYMARRKRGPHIRLSDKGMGLTYFPKSWMFARRGENINDPTKYTRIDIPNSYTIENASKI